MKTRLWNVILNGRLPALQQFATIEGAVSFVAEKTGETPDQIRRDNEAECPTMIGRNEYDIEKERDNER